MAEIDERHPPIKPRRVKFDWRDLPLHWIPGDPVGTHALNAFQLILPTGERWFVQVYRDALPLIQDDRLREEVKGFMGQEAVHAYSHEAVLNTLLDKYGVNHRKVTHLPERVLATRSARRRKMPPWLRRRALLMEVAAISAIEHYTAVLGQWMLDNEALERSGADPTMMDLFRWHAAEEVEHRSVAFDVFQYLSRDLKHPMPLRVVTWVNAVIALYTAAIFGTYFLLREDPTVTRKVTLPRMLRSIRASQRKGHVPPWGVLLREARTYLDPAHHPSKVCSTEQALDYLRRSPAALAAGYDPY